ncbi:hypothetical protein [Thermoanaerobacterium sp. DL9XJH110]|uniref:hypothetical protein n=1 Tax=Thermoanaerobacterium sp. DL9XJH110 TaxID=3386643 RepID=UPI003BB50BE4
MLNVFKYAEERGKQEGFLEALNKHSRAKNSAFFSVPRAQQSRNLLAGESPVPVAAKGPVSFRAGCVRNDTVKAP